MATPERKNSHGESKEHKIRTVLHDLIRLIASAIARRVGNQSNQEIQQYHKK